MRVGKKYFSMVKAFAEGKLMKRIASSGDDKMKNAKIDVAFDMETGDPDDVFTLCFLTSHPSINLRAVTVMPGSLEQVGLVRRVLEATGHAHVPVGSKNPGHSGKCVSPIHFKMFGETVPGRPDGLGHEVLADTIRKFPDTVVLGGAPVHNLRLLLEKHPDIDIKQLVVQGGFAGDSVVPPEYRLKKFAGYETYPTFNFNGDLKGALLLLSSERVHRRLLVPKNITHRAVYDGYIQEKMAQVKDKTPGLRLIHDGMEVYLSYHREGKKFHDPLAACAIVAPGIFEWREMEAYQVFKDHKGHRRSEWGSRLKEGTSTYIAVSFDKKRFIETLMCNEERG